MVLRSWGRGPGSVFKLGEQSLSRQSIGAVGAEEVGWGVGRGCFLAIRGGFGEGAPDDRKYSDETVKMKLCMKP